MDTVFTLALGSQVAAVRFRRVGMQRTHVQQAGNLGRGRGIGDQPRQFGVDPREAALLCVALVEDADQVDDGPGHAEVLAQLVGVEHIGLDEADVRVHEQLPVTLAPARQYVHRVAVARQAVRQVITDESGSTQQAEWCCFSCVDPVACAQGIL